MVLKDLFTDVHSLADKFGVEISQKVFIWPFKISYCNWKILNYQIIVGTIHLTP
jgi:hypothetical protein